MKKLAFLVLFAVTVAQAQVHRFVYEYKYIPDLNKKDSVASDMMALDITDKGSLYQSLGRIEADSIMRERFKNFTPGGNANIDMRNMRRGLVSYKVEKEYPDFKTYLLERVGRDSYKVLENEKQTWTILPETQKIGEYKAQKATTNWGGRSWIAWFSTDIPFQDGPYKFSGLPGLIVKLEDTTGSHIMTLVGNKNVKPVETETASPAGNRGRMNQPTITVSEDQFKKAWKTYAADPSRDLREMTSRNGISAPRIMNMSRNGQPVDPKELAKRMQDNIKNDNNRIEPTLYDQK